MKKLKYKMTFEVICKFNELIDEETFAKEYKNDLLKLCKQMYKLESLGFFDENLRLIKAEFTNLLT